MDRHRQRNEAEMQAVMSELQALKRKLHSKTEALLIISKDLDSTQKERDQYKLMAEKLRVRCQAFKRQFSDYPLTRDQASMIQMLRDMKNQKLAHQRQSESLQQKLNEALGDVKLLRERFARQRIGDEGVGPRYFAAHEREELVVQLENAKQMAEQYRQECNIVSDEISELRLENKEFKMKSERLNSELNFMLSGDKKRIIDIDALCMENKYLQERVKQCQEEKNSLHAQLNKLKAVLNARKATQSEITPGRMRSSGLVISPKQVKEILLNGAGLPSSSDTVADLQSIAAALLETINDKNLALHHLRNTNKILGNRVAELERKLRTLEVAGLWNMTGIPHHAGHSTPKITVETPKKKIVEDNLPPTTETDEEFMSSLGSRLSRLTDVCAKSFKEYKLVSLTPDSSDTSSRGSAANLTGDAMSGRGSTNNLSIEPKSSEDSATDTAGNTMSNGGDATNHNDNPANHNNNATLVGEGVTDPYGATTCVDCDIANKNGAKNATNMQCNGDATTCGNDVTDTGCSNDDVIKIDDVTKPDGGIDDAAGVYATCSLRSDTEAAEKDDAIRPNHCDVISSDDVTVGNTVRSGDQRNVNNNDNSHTVQSKDGAQGDVIAGEWHLDDVIKDDDVITKETAMPDKNQACHE